MTVKEYYTQNINENIDEKIYEEAKSKSRKWYLFVFSIVLFALAFIVGLIWKVSTIVVAIDGYFNLELTLELLYVVGLFIAGADSDSAKFKKAIDFLTIIFNQMDALLIDKSAKTNEQAVDNDTDDSTYEKLLQLKKLLDEGIIDQVTYEEKKKKLVDKL